MKNPVLSKLSVGLVGVILIQFIVTSLQNVFLSNSVSKLNQQLNSLDQKITALAPAANDSVILALGNLREELVKYRAEQMGRDQILGVMNNSSGDSLSSTLDQAIATIEKQSGAINITPTSTPTSTPTTTPSRVAKLKSGWTKVDVYEKSQASSKIIGQALANQTYPILASQNGWFQINLNNSQVGYVQSQFIDETNY